jgi:hypothetical protein
VTLLGEWSIEVEVPASLPDSDAELVTQALTRQLQKWAEEFQARLSREFGTEISVSSI